MPDPVINIVNNGSNSEPPRTNHLLHLVLTILTGGLWLPVWIVVRVARGR